METLIHQSTNKLTSSLVKKAAPGEEAPAEFNGFDTLPDQTFPDDELDTEVEVPRPPLPSYNTLYYESVTFGGSRGSWLPEDLREPL